MIPRTKVTERVCALVRQGSSLREIADKPRMPRFATLTRWLAEDDEFRARYADALAIQRAVLADDVVSIADKGDDSKAADRKVRIDARKWRVRVGKDEVEDDAHDGPPENLDVLLERAIEIHEERRRKRADAIARGEITPTAEDEEEEETEEEVEVTTEGREEEDA